MALEATYNDVTIPEAVPETAPAIVTLPEIETVHAKPTFPEITETSYSRAFANFNRATYTLFVAPEHDKLHEALEEACLDGTPQPLQPSLESTVEQLQNDVLPKLKTLESPALEGDQYVNLGAALIQFTDYIPKLHPVIKIPYDDVGGLHEIITERAKEEGVLGYAEQMDAALEYTDGDLTDALWQLFITSRLYGRWLDSKIMDGIPDYDETEKITLMQEWRASVAACKPQEPGQPQDPEGDVYYTWTHALAKFFYSTNPDRTSLTSRSAIGAFHYGTYIMHNTVHVFNKQTVQSDHSTAAAYGNAIGQLCVNTARES